ncbi:putative membrane protein YesL [Natronobacillus azotifigens]|uniref:YesL family protein n=1 Tax=Natronobacillus azotifigens TaxID=472978 RepID=A0A9J6RG22_9BACI|nr:YesL family protein [Natronobacillus azotifigens]MCZ0704283.1 YesL family protein [Natronobacillus azotifigens]
MENNYGFIHTKFYRAMEWIWRFAYLNLLWLAFSLVGFVIFGLFPATAALFAVVRKWLIGDPDVSVFKTFFETYKKDFIKANGLGYLLLPVGYILLFNFQYIGEANGIEHTILSIGWVMSALLFITVAVFLFPVYVHYELPFFRNFKVALLLALSSPLTIASLILSVLLAYTLFYLVPGLIPVFLTSVFGWLFMWNATHAFRRLEQKKDQLDNGEYQSIITKGKQLKEKVRSALR